MKNGGRIAIAIVAMGGQGGGVLSDWLVTLAQAQGWVVQSTSVPGVAQRTGATIYYVELFPPGAGQDPVLALMPGSGDVDLVIAAEWMEAGRAIVRGLVTPDRTTLVASTHRSYATLEKVVPGNGIADSGVVADAARIAAQRLVAFDMAVVADEHQTVISAPLFGAIAATGVLPFAVEHFEAAVRSGGVGVERSLAGFAAAHAQALALLAGGADDSGEANEETEAINVSAAAGIAPVISAPPQIAPTGLGDHTVLPATPLGERIGRLPPGAHDFALEGARRCVDYLDADHAVDYLGRLEALAATHQDGLLIREVARWLALRMCFEDPIRVADLKTRRQRFGAIRAEVKLDDGQLIQHTEYMHPRFEEVIDTLPVKWAIWIRDNAWFARIIRSRFSRGLLFRTTTLTGFTAVWALARMDHWRRSSLRFEREMTHINEWLVHIDRIAKQDLALAAALARTARVIKGYGDTHVRSLALYERLVTMADRLVGMPDAGRILDGLIEAALADAIGAALDARATQHGLNVATTSGDETRAGQIERSAS